MFVLTHRGGPPRRRGATTYSFVTDGFESAIKQAMKVAGPKDVGLHGATPVQQALRAGLLDELTIHLVPVLLGAGRRLFENLGDTQVHLERTQLIDAPDVTHLRYKVKRKGAGDWKAP